MEDNLRKLGKDEKWLEKQVAKFKIKPKDALVVTIDGEGQFSVKLKKGKIRMYKEIVVCILVVILIIVWI